jgi:uncharacterized protein
VTPDVNLLVAAFRAEHVHHGIAKKWLIEATEQPGVQPNSIGSAAKPLFLMPVVMASFLRLVTNPRVFENPSQISQAIDFLDDLFAYPGVATLPSTNAWPTLRQMSLEKKLIGNAIPDAFIAAQVLQSNEILATFDRDYQNLLPAEQLQLLIA